MNNDSNEINLENEQKRIKSKIERINQSGVFGKIKSVLEKLRGDFRSEGIKNINLQGRVKKTDSASEKIAKQRISADNIYDLIGFMLVVDLPEEYSDAKEIMGARMPEGSFVHDFDGKSPGDNGYSSFHMGINVQKLLAQYGIQDPSQIENLSSEVQLKTYGMYMAQESTHDVIYKNPNLSQEQRNELQNVMFPLIEKITDIQKYEERMEDCRNEEGRNFYESRIASTKQQILQHKMENKDYIDANMENVEMVFKQYIVEKYIEKVRNSPILSERFSSKEEIETLRAECENAIAFIAQQYGPDRMSNTEPTGFKNIDEILGIFKDITPEQIHELSEQSQSVSKPPILESAIDKTKENVTARDIQDMSTHLSTRGIDGKGEENPLKESEDIVFE